MVSRPSKTVRLAVCIISIYQQVVVANKKTYEKSGNELKSMDRTLNIAGFKKLKNCKYLIRKEIHFSKAVQ